LQIRYTRRFGQDGVTPVTYARGSKRLDYILMDSTILMSMKKIGILDLH